MELYEAGETEAKDLFPNTVESIIKNEKAILLTHEEKAISVRDN